MITSLIEVTYRPDVTGYRVLVCNYNIEYLYRGDSVTDNQTDGWAHRDNNNIQYAKMWV